jgi:hypothetical protein
MFLDALQHVIGGVRRCLARCGVEEGLMVFAASLLLADTRTDSPTIILLSDRTQLVRQTSGVFTSAVGRAYFHQPATSQELRALLADDVSGVISTTVHKFADAGRNLSAPGQHHRDGRRGVPHPVRPVGVPLRADAGGAAEREVLRHDRHPRQEPGHRHLRPVRRRDRPGQGAAPVPGVPVPARRGDRPGHAGPAPGRFREGRPGPAG